MSRRLRQPAVVVNSETAGIGIIHSLGLAGVDIVTVEKRWPLKLGHFSRFVRRRVFYDERQGETMASKLLEIADDFDGTPVLFPSTDLDLEDLIQAHAALSRRYHVPANPDIGTRIFEKNWQYELAEKSGMPIPRNVRFAAGAPANVDGFRFPLIIKPSSRAETAGDRVFRLRLLDTPDDLKRCLDDIAREFPGREFQIGENIPGEPDQLYTVGSYSDRHGKVLRSYTGRKITQWPYYHGMASISESLELPPRVADDARRLLEEARFHGISQVECKYDPRDDAYKLLEINGRSWLWVKLAAFSGVNLPLIQYYDLTGDARLAQAVAAPQRHDRFFVYDFHVRLNARPDEQQKIDALSRSKTMVPAIFHPGDWRLGLVHRVTSQLKLWRRSA